MEKKTKTQYALGGSFPGGDRYIGGSCPGGCSPRTKTNTTLQLFFKKQTIHSKLNL